MYIYQRSYLKQKGSGAGYVDVDVSRVTMRAILQNYLDGYLVLKHTQLTGTHYLTISALRGTSVPIDLNRTLEGWFNSIYDKALPTILKEPQYRQSVVSYSDGISAGFDINRVGRYLDVDANISDADKVDLQFKKTVVSVPELYQHMLVSVGGFMHRCEVSNNAIAAIGAGKTFNQSGINTTGVYSFYSCCSIKQIGLTEDMLGLKTPTTPLNEALVINVGESLINKSVLICIGGYLLLDQSIVSVPSAETGVVVVDTSKLDLIKMMYHSVDTIDLSAIGLFKSESVKNYPVRMNEILSDVSLKKYYTLDQSFVVILDAPTVSVAKKVVSRTGLPSVYETKDKPRLPLVSSVGILQEYLKIPQQDMWTLRLRSSVTKRYAYHTNLELPDTMINALSATNDWYMDDPKLVAITITKKLN